MATTTDNQPAEKPHSTSSREPTPAQGQATAPLTVGQRPRTGKPRLPASVPGRPAAWLAGRFLRTLWFAYDTIPRAGELFEEYGNLVALCHRGGTNLFNPRKGACPGSVLVRGPELLKTVCTQHDIYHKFNLVGRLFPDDQDIPPRKRPLRTLAGGLFGVDGDEHRRHRRLIMPSLHKGRVHSYRDQMVTITEDELSRWQDGQVIDISQVMTQLTKRVVTDTLFGADIGEDQEGTGELVLQAFRTLNSPWARLLPIDLPGFSYHRFVDLAGRLEERIRQVIAQKQATGTDDGTVLSMLIQARYEGTDPESPESCLTEEELIGHVSTLFAAGHETSANALSWTLCLLSQHPQVTQNLLEELDGVLGGSAPRVEQLEQLAFLDRVIKESMRLITPVPWNWRITSQETELGGHLLPAETEVMASIYHTHHMPEVFPQPQRFDPSRWETINPTPYEYNPFSAGPRMCIGATFAVVEIKIVLAILLQRFSLKLATNRIDHTGTIVLRPKQGMPMKVDRRRPSGGAQQTNPADLTGSIRELVELPAGS